MIHNEKEFYNVLLKAINLDMKEKEFKNADHLLKNDYTISRTQYYNIKKIASGDIKTPRLSHVRLMQLSKYLKLDLHILFEVKDKRSR